MSTAEPDAGESGSYGAAGRDARLAFALASATLLFFFQALSVLLASEFALAYDAVYPAFNARLLLLGLLPAAAMLAPALPFSLWLDRRLAIASVAIVAAIARVAMCVAEPLPRLVAAAIVIACGAVFLGKVVGWVERRAVAAAVATALTLEPMLRFAGLSWDPSLRPGWLPVQALLSLGVIAIAIVWSRAARPAYTPHAAEQGLERRAGGVRLRGAVAFACVIFIEQAALGRPEAVAHWTGSSYEAAAFATIVGGAAAAALLLTAPDPMGWERFATMVLAVLAAGGAALLQAGAVRGAAALALAAVAQAGALLLLDRALVPAGGRRRGWRLAAGLVLLLGLHIAYALTFFYPYTWPALEGDAGRVLFGSGLLLLLSLALMPRQLPPPLRLVRPAVAAVAVVASAATAALLAARATAEPMNPDAGDAFGVATYNVHYGFDAGWRYDPESIARTIEAARVDAVALQEVPAGVPALYGTDLPLWLGRRLGSRVYFAPSVNGLLGQAILTREPVQSFTIGELPATGGKAVLATLVIELDGRLVTLHATHLSDRREPRVEQLTPLIAAVSHTDAALLVGDLNAEPGSVVALALEHAGFRDAFTAAGVRADPTAPADAPAVRIDWIWVRGLEPTDAAVLPSAASDHRLVRATVRPTR